MTGPTRTRVTLLTQADCAYCQHAKDVLCRVGHDHPLAIEEVDLSSERGKQLAIAAGFLFAPGILLNGRPFTYGRLSERRLRRALALPEE